MARSGVAAGLVTIAVGAGLALAARGIPDPGVDVLGPAAAPVSLGLVIAATGLGLLVAALRGQPAAGDAPPRVRLGVLAAAVALLVAYVHALEWAGFVLATALFSAASLALLGTRAPLRLVATSAGIAVGTALIFGRLLGVDLPAGRLFG